LALGGQRLLGEAGDGHLPRAHEANRAVHRHQRVAHQAQDVRVAGHERVAQRLVGQTVEDRRRAHLAPGARVDARLLRAIFAGDVDLLRLVALGVAGKDVLAGLVDGLADRRRERRHDRLHDARDDRLLRRELVERQLLRLDEARRRLLALVDFEHLDVGIARRIDARLLVVELDLAAAVHAVVARARLLGNDRFQEIRIWDALVGQIADVDVRRRELDHVDLLDVAGVKLELLVDFQDVGGIITDMTGAGLFGDAVLHRDIGGLIVELALLTPLFGELVGPSHLLPKSAVGDHGAELGCNGRAQAAPQNYYEKLTAPGTLDPTSGALDHIYGWDGV